MFMETLLKFFTVGDFYSYKERMSYEKELQFTKEKYNLKNYSYYM